jgi:hypothetical protein
MDEHRGAQARRLVATTVLGLHAASCIAGPVPADCDATRLLILARRLGAGVDVIQRRNGLYFDPPYPGASQGVEHTPGGLRVVAACRVVEADGTMLGMAFTTVIPGRRPRVSVAPDTTPMPPGWRPLR